MDLKSPFRTIGPQGLMEKLKTSLNNGLSPHDFDDRNA